MEDHTHPAPPDVVTTLCLINTKTSTVSTLVSGADFYAFPYFSPDGTRLAWQQWLHPDMPWEGAEIYIAKIAADTDRLTLSDITYVGGKKNDISASYPSWASNDVLLFTSDESGYQNPWTYSISLGNISPVLPEPANHDFSEPAHSLGVEYGTPLDSGANKALFAALKDDKSILYVVTLKSGALEELDCPYVGITAVKRITEDSVVFLADRSDAARSIVICSLTDYAKPSYTVLKASSVTEKFPPTLISVAKSLLLKTQPNDEPLHVLYLPPHNPDYSAPEGEKPPCIINAHGGPTGRSSLALSWEKQYYTSRGWAW